MDVQLLGRRPHLLAAMIPGTVPDEHHLVLGFAQPLGQLLQEADRVLAIAPAPMPEEDTSLGEVIGTVPLQAFVQPRRGAGPPSPLTLGSPGVAQVQVLMDVGFIDKHQPYLIPQHALEEGLKLLHKLDSRRRVGLDQQLLDALPGETGPFQDPAQGVPAGLPFQVDGYPPLELLEGPDVTGQTMVNGLAFLYRLDDLCLLFGAKRGGRPPLRR